MSDVFQGTAKVWQCSAKADDWRLVKKKMAAKVPVCEVLYSDIIRP